MESLVILFYKWEIQLLVVLSFILQMFLFFTGSLRRHNTNIFLRFFIWIAYLGADLVAVYALGYLSRHEDVAIVWHILRRAQPLAFFWAPFLLIHLGGQDTITAFAMEDNNLWLRHFLNLVVQVVLAVYVFWKSVGRHGMELLVSGVFVFIAGIIKYGERTWSLRYGSFKHLESSTGHEYKPRLPEVAHVDAGNYSNIVRDGLCSMPDVLNIFIRRSFSDGGRWMNPPDNKRMFKEVELQLGIIYDDLYTKALVLRTGSGVTLRCISQISVVVAFALFLACDKRRYSRADIVITYSLFIGALFLDLCAMFIFVLSPWTWAWLKAREYDSLANLSMNLFSSDIGWPERKPRWSNSMGQYNSLIFFTGSDQPARTCNQQVMTVARRLVNLLGAKKEKIFWMSKLLDNEYVEVDEKTMQCVLKGISRIHDEFFEEEPREWPNLCGMLEESKSVFIADFGFAIVMLHMFTRQHLSKYDPLPSDTSDAMVEVCRKLSNYMMYLFLAHPEMLPLRESTAAALQQAQESSEDLNSKFNGYGIGPGKETLEEMVDLWTRLLIYAAGQSPPEAHAAQLARGGELITFVWLLMARGGFGDLGRSTGVINRVRITNAFVGAYGNTGGFREVYVFCFPRERSSPERSVSETGSESVSERSVSETGSELTSVQQQQQQQQQQGACMLDGSADE